MKQTARPVSIATLKPLTDGRVAPIVSHVVGDAVPLAPHPNRHAATKYVNALWDVRWIAWDSWNIALRSAS